MTQQKSFGRIRFVYITLRIHTVIYHTRVRYTLYSHYICIRYILHYVYVYIVVRETYVAVDSQRRRALLPPIPTLR